MNLVFLGLTLLITLPLAIFLAAGLNTAGVTAVAICLVFGGATLFSILAIRKSRFPLSQPVIDREEMRSGGLDGLVDALSTRHASVEKDMAFGIQSIVQKLHQKNLPLPDYTQSKEQIYRRLASNMIDATAHCRYSLRRLSRTSRTSPRGLQTGPATSLHSGPGLNNISQAPPMQRLGLLHGSNGKQTIVTP